MKELGVSWNEMKLNNEINSDEEARMLEEH